MRLRSWKRTKTLLYCIVLYLPMNICKHLNVCVST